MREAYTRALYLFVSGSLESKTYTAFGGELVRSLLVIGEVSSWAIGEYGAMRSLGRGCFGTWEWLLEKRIT